MITVVEEIFDSFDILLTKFSIEYFLFSVLPSTSITNKPTEDENEYLE
jgi:hypothetical protein